METNTTLYVSSGKELGEPIKTKLTIDFSRLTPEHIKEYAIDSLVIKWRATYKNSKKPYPKEDIYIAPVPGVRSAPTMTPFDALVIIAGSKEKALEVVNKVGSVEAALEMLKSILE